MTNEKIQAYLEQARAIQTVPTIQALGNLLDALILLAEKVEALEKQTETRMDLLLGWQDHHDWLHSKELTGHRHRDGHYLPTTEPLAPSSVSPGTVEDPLTATEPTIMANPSVAQEPEFTPAAIQPFSPSVPTTTPTYPVAASCGCVGTTAMAVCSRCGQPWSDESTPVQTASATTST